MFDVKTLQADAYQIGDANSQIRCKSIQKRAEKVKAQYEKHAIQIDTKYNGLSADRSDMGPVERQLATYEVIGLGVGAYGEVSRSMYELIDQIAEALAGIYGAELGYDNRETQLEMTKRYVMREMAATIMTEEAWMVLHRYQRHASIRDSHHREVMALSDVLDEPDRRIAWDNRLNDNGFDAQTA